MGTSDATDRAFHPILTGPTGPTPEPCDRSPQVWRKCARNAAQRAWTGGKRTSWPPAWHSTRREHPASRADPSAVTWGAQPTTTATGAAVSTASYGYSSACPANFMRWNVADIAQAWADGQPNHGLQIKVVDETDSLTWRRFRSANFVNGSQGPTEPALSVTYNTKPGMASPVSPADGTVTADTTPTLSAKATDPDGNTVRFTIEVWNAAGTTLIASGKTPYTASGAAGSWTAPALAAGSYKWRIATYDGTDWNGSWSVWRTLAVDTSVAAAPALSSATYPADGLWHGDAGQAGTFRIADPTGKAVSSSTPSTRPPRSSPPSPGARRLSPGPRRPAAPTP
ncbi:DNRLRE domain-containing protein [Streptomyces sp. NPDC056004]|uniref:DNRLRE domain-containing protein n=1 Tax=Streptomyces sp. NPDC056004 TaxID=3345677 RepID=UPI0035DCA2BE